MNAKEGQPAYSDQQYGKYFTTSVNLIHVIKPFAKLVGASEGA